MSKWRCFTSVVRELPTGSCIANDIRASDDCLWRPDHGPPQMLGRSRLGERFRPAHFQHGYQCLRDCQRRTGVLTGDEQAILDHI